MAKTNWFTKDCKLGKLHQQKRTATDFLDMLNYQSYVFLNRPDEKFLGFVGSDLSSKFDCVWRSYSIDGENIRIVPVLLMYSPGYENEEGSKGDWRLFFKGIDDVSYEKVFTYKDSAIKFFNKIDILTDAWVERELDYWN